VAIAISVKRPSGFNDNAKLHYQQGPTRKKRRLGAGRHWEDWVKAYNEKKTAGEENISLQPEALE